MDEKPAWAEGGANHWALRFISGKYQGSEFPLPPDRELLVGRASNTDMVLLEDMVSRNHAKIVVTSDGVTIEDLGSTNGTFVNGEKIKRAKLRDGDRVLIGTSILKLVRQPAVPAALPKRGEPAPAQAAPSTPRPRSLQGDLGEQGLPSLLQLLVTSKESGTLVIEGPRSARLHFRQGQLLRATIEGPVPATGKRALHRIFSWQSGSFEVLPAAGEVQREFEEPTEALVAEALKHAEEARRARERLPAGATHFELARPLVPALKDLSPKRLDTLQLVLNLGDLESILDHNPIGDLETYRHLLFLLQKGYVQVSGR